MEKFTEVKTKIRSFVSDSEDTVIHISQHHPDEFMVIYEDAYELLIGNTKFINGKQQLKNEYGIDW